MKLYEKLNYLQSHHMKDWLITKQQIENDLSRSQSRYCICGRLATGLHEMHCTRFRNRVITQTVKILAHLIPSKSFLNIERVER